MGSMTTKSPLGNIPEAFLGLLKAQAQWGQEYYEAVTGTKMPPISDPLNALKQAVPKPVCHVPPPCWMPRSIGEVVSYVDGCGKACVRLVITNCDRTARTVTVRAEPAGPDSSKAPIKVEPSVLSLGPMARGRVEVCLELPEGAEDGTRYESLVWVDGCRQHYLRWTVLVGAGGLDSTYEVVVDDCPDYRHHWYDHFYCPRPCPSSGRSTQLG